MEVSSQGQITSEKEWVQVHHSEENEECFQQARGLVFHIAEFRPKGVVLCTEAGDSLELKVKSFDKSKISI